MTQGDLARLEGKLDQILSFVEKVEPLLERALPLIDNPAARWAAARRAGNAKP